LFYQRFRLNISSISHQQAVAELLDLPNTKIFQSEDVASGVKSGRTRTFYFFYISHQQAVAEHLDLPNTEIFQSKDVASV
jgi:hypothetical protein